MAITEMNFFSGGESECKTYSFSCNPGNDCFYVTHGDDALVKFKYNAATGDYFDDDNLTLTKTSNSNAYTLTFKASCTLYYGNDQTTTKAASETMSLSGTGNMPVIAIFD